MYQNYLVQNSNNTVALLNSTSPTPETIALMDTIGGTNPVEGFTPPSDVITNFYNATMLGASEGLETSQMISSTIYPW